MNDSSIRAHRGLGRWFSYLNSLSIGDRFIFSTIFLIFIVSGTFSLLKLNETWLVTSPTTGGKFTEGMVGAPRFVNPVLAITRVDTDLSALIYSGLMRIDSEGNLVPDLAESVTISDDGKVYNLLIKENASFSDGTPLTSNDVAYTISQIQNPELKSPIRGNWNEVSVEVINDRELNFVLKDRYTPFIENLTLGILPHKTWGELSVEEFPFSNRNTEPIGSGPYKIKEVTRTPDGLIGSYILVRNESAIKVPRIEVIKISFFDTEKSLTTALEDGTVDATASLSLSGDSYSELPNDFTATSYPLPRVFTVFVNQNRSSILRDISVRKALNAAIDRNALIETALGGAGQPTTIAIPTGFHDVQSDTSSTGDIDYAAEARTILQKGGWKDNGTGGWQKDINGSMTTLSLKLATGNTDYFEKTSKFLKESWQAAGIDVEVALYEQADLSQTVIRPREYELLLFGTDISRSLDLYSFWHSSHREDPGLNISFYTNIAGDRELENFRTAEDEDSATKSLVNFLEIQHNEVPAVFLYNPSAVYIYNSALSVKPTERISRISDRFSTIADWYIETESLWPFMNIANNN